MKYKIITDNEIRILPIPEQFFRYADAYLMAAIRQCDFVAESQPDGRWSDATVALFQAAHAIELFLKGAILLRDPEANIAGPRHDISELHRTFRRLFPEPEFDWEVPFSAIDADQDVPKVIKAERSSQSMLLRYPRNQKNGQWSQITAMEPMTFKADLLEWQERVVRLRMNCQSIS